MRVSMILLFAILCVAEVAPVESISRWFSSSYYDMRITFRRFGYCMTGLSPMRDYKLDETEYLVHSMKSFLDEANLSNEQMANVSNLMERICPNELESNGSSYPISSHLNVSRFDGVEGKEARCRAIDEALDAMYPLLKRAALNRSEPLDFSTIRFQVDPKNRDAFYNLTDLISAAWIKSEAFIEQVCGIKNATNRHIQAKMSSERRAGGLETSRNVGVLGNIFELIDRMLEPILGLQRRLYWESNNRFERVVGALTPIRDGISRGLKSTRERIFSRTNSTMTNSTINQTNATLGSTRTPLPTTSAPVTTPAPSRMVASSTASAVSGPAPSTVTSSAKPSTTAARAGNTAADEA